MRPPSPVLSVSGSMPLQLVFVRSGCREVFENDICHAVIVPSVDGLRPRVQTLRTLGTLELRHLHRVGGMFPRERAGSVSAEVTVDVPKFPCTCVVVSVSSDDVAIRAMVSVR